MLALLHHLNDAGQKEARLPCSRILLHTVLHLVSKLEQTLHFPGRENVEA